ncbi:hypothetical protein QBC39DRAFT_353834 [Podospora conica]|nr:hypothetical protein QBC39DRAFT_353834 [Schizothecium conicum]
MASLGECPDEIIRHVLLYVSPEDALLRIQLVSHRFFWLANEPLLWKHHCRRSFTYWHPDHRFQWKLAEQAPSIKWKKLWVTRKKSNIKVARLLDGVIETKVGQLKRIQQICHLGYDAKDYLLEQCHCDPSAEDFLARRYYANSVLDSMHRGIAVDAWSKYQGNALSGRGLDRALGAFDMFVLHDQPQDLDYICNTFDSIAREFRQENRGFHGWTTRQKALSLVRWIRERNLTGMDNPEADYRNLRNCFIGHALSDDRHESIPIISAAIFCCVAERLGLTSSLCAFPSHAHASVFSTPGFTLDDIKVDVGTPSSEMECMYLDPFGSDHEVNMDDLRDRFIEFNWALGAEAFLKASPVTIIVQRTAHSIRDTHATIQHVAVDTAREKDMKRLRSGHPDLNLEAAHYAAMWAELMMKQSSSFHWGTNLDAFLNRFALSWSQDAWIVEKYLVPLYDRFVAAQPPERQRIDWENVRAILRMLANLDSRRPVVSRRYTQDIRSRVRYRIGQVFQHKRYRYVGIINGWAANGTTALPTPHYELAQEEQDRGAGADLPNGNSRREEDKTYYTCLRPTVDRLRVDQDNMIIITDPALIPDSLFYLAGKFFRRFDPETCTFVSNIRECYPDD